MKNKKGSMELGINAIVVLIIALALLGLGIGFVTKLFTASQSKMVRIIDRTELPIHADSLNPIVFDTSNIQMKSNTDERLIVSVYNEGRIPAANVYVQDFDSCIDSDGIGANDQIDIVSPMQDIPPAIDAGFSVIIKADANAKGSYICTVGAAWYDYDAQKDFKPTRQLFIDVI